MIRSIIKIDREACNGCGLCVQACHEGAIALVDGKAQLIRDDYCDGLGNCLPVCPTGAITIEQREAAAYDEQAVQARMGQPSGCPGSAPQQRVPQQATPLEGTCPSQLSHWPVQIQLVPLQAPYLEGAHLLVAADCTPFAYGDFHNRFLRGRVALVGCPKLDPVDYTEYSKCHGGAHGGPLLRRSGAGGPYRLPAERKTDPLSGGDHRSGWDHQGGEERRIFHVALVFHLWLRQERFPSCLPLGSRQGQGLELLKERKVIL